MTERPFDYQTLSRTVSHYLRHEPWVYELELDAEGWVRVEELLAALIGENPDWGELWEIDLVEMIGQSDKKRHELKDGKIRALYGHSTPYKLLKESAHYLSTPTPVQIIRPMDLPKGY